MRTEAIFIGTEQAITDAYSDQVRCAVAAMTELMPGYLDEAALREAASQGLLTETEYIFSTWGMVPLSEDEIALYMPSLKAVFYAAGTVRAFALPFLKRGVRVFSAWGANAVPVAEFTVSEIILANKAFFRGLHRGGAAGWPEHDGARPCPGNYGTLVGIIGAGMIGSMVTERLKQYNLRTEVFDPFLSYERAADLGAKKVERIEQVFEDCQVVSNHLADNPQTAGMIGKSCFDRMDPRGVFINTGRGRQVVESELIAALKKSPSRTAVLDVTWPEPPEKGSELYTLPNVFLTPHIAGSLGSEIQRMGEYMFAEFEAFISGKPTKYEVTEAMLATMA